MEQPVASRRRSSPWPYVLIAPSLASLALILGYPLARLAQLSFQQYGLAEIISGSGIWVGLQNYRGIFTDREFWLVLLRTFGFTFAIVAATILIGAALAHLMVKLHPVVRRVLNFVLILVWAIPQLVSISVWRWMFSFDFSIITSTLHRLGFDAVRVNYFENPIVGFTIIGACIVWGALPFVAISIYAALMQVPKEMLEAAAIDGARPRQILRHIILPVLLPVYVILISLSVIWDFQVFSHIWVFLENRPSSDYYTMAVYAFQKSFGMSEYGKGAAISVVMILALVGVTGYYLRQMVRMGDEA